MVALPIVLKPIGLVRHKATEAQIREEHRDLEGELEIFPEFEPALDGIDGFSHLFVLSYFDRLRPEQIGPLQVKPRRLLKKGYKPEELPTLGVFALDSPTRPNPVGLTLVRLLRREGRRLIVTGLDCFDGTPILDIKGYRPAYRADQYSVPDFHTRLMDEKGHL
ncbi:MAG: tRNA (N6-threonylcarbamoyladenosine(37)-N6)-methyltransferase TrmO [Betaproteobacteria bacterium RIFCSPLOWO2_02_FULL_62_17]|nr:MAG: tRNA (N6-threonylcarbamoyladenosine(37)-N6)-methyltransferase TrmO [Betaproteobacteria bacterium RIFCSPLOWO2_02_FULL_62_17]